MYGEQYIDELLDAQSKSLDTFEVKETPEFKDTTEVDEFPEVQGQSKCTGEEDGFHRKLYCTIFFISDKTFDIIQSRKTHKIGDQITVGKHPGMVVGVFGKILIFLIQGAGEAYIFNAEFLLRP